MWDGVVQYLVVLEAVLGVSGSQAERPDLLPQERCETASALVAHNVGQVVQWVRAVLKKRIGRSLRITYIFLEIYYKGDPIDKLGPKYSLR